jgi:HK97 family phage portal protein
MIISRLFESMRMRNSGGQGGYSNPDTYGAPLAWLQGLDIPVHDTLANLENSQQIHTAFRCINILSDDIASMPLQTFEKVGQRMMPDGMMRNLSWMLENEPNRWMSPFIFKKTVMRWLINYGEAFIWMPPMKAGQQNELIVLPANRTRQLVDMETGLIWYRVMWNYWEPQFNQEMNPAYYPDVEVAKLLINSIDGLTGRGVIEFARDTMSRQLGANKTQGNFYKKGLNPGGLLWMTGEMSKEARNKVRNEYEEQMSGSENASRLAVMDPKATRFDQITMKPVDAQFLESIMATDTQIANFYGIPLYKLNLGKQSYESNAQLDLDYMKTTLNSYLVQWENEGRRKWLTLDQQNRGFYIKFNRDIILATDASTRATYLEKKILSGQLTPNEAREIDDMPAYTGGNQHYIPANMNSVDAVGTPAAAPATAPATPQKPGGQPPTKNEVVMDLPADEILEMIGGKDASDQNAPHGNGHHELVGRSGRSGKSK